eukprot:TRINITY_DN12904_c0_g1_i1.p1 TRINITY_DN12904_c0_g1~~TRINITY_DN12904_c0_g1_i1.p1  ORF type:complete len:1021 (-),score=279.54 TRINITY_DN12904_c0_g1_i1:233-2959(-)
MADKNQLIRALALRVMASIRVHDIVQLIILAIRKCSTDSSPYVRKAAAHAIPKVYSLDTGKADELVEIIATLLKDNSTMVLGSALAAFNEVCPDNFEMIHQYFRKLCHLLVDTNEWGQISIINMLLRYGRANFVNVTEAEKGDQLKESAFYSDEDESADEADVAAKEAKVEMDPDHRLLLKSVLPLVQSRNTGVVLAVANLYYHLAPLYEAQKMGKSLVRIMRNSNEIQYVVLANIATMATLRPSMFAPALKEFFVRSTEPSYCRTLKLEIITHLATSGTISTIMKEFKTYVKSPDEPLIIATIQAVGRVAHRLPDVADNCLRTLLALLSARSEVVVAEAVIEIKKILQSHPDEHDSVLTTLAKLMDTTTAPTARSAIVWLIGQYCKKIPKVAPDVLRKLAKSFCDEEENVKLQTLNLALKLYVTNPSQSSKLFQYVTSMARYDASYDIRDRARLMRKLTNLDGKSGAAALSATEIEDVFLGEKPIPIYRSPSDDRSRFTISTLSHIVAHAASGYTALPDHPTTPSDRKLRDPPADSTWATKTTTAPPKSTKPTRKPKKDDFYSDSGTESDASTRSSRSSRSSGSSRSSRSGSSYSSSASRSRSSASSHTGSSRSGSTSGSESPPPPKHRSAAPATAASTTAATAPPAAKKSESLFDLLNMPVSGGGSDSAVVDYSMLNASHAAATRPQYPLLDGMKAGGLGVNYSFTREPSIYGGRMITVRLYFTNTSSMPIQSIAAVNIKPESGSEAREFEPVPALQPGATDYRNMAINFNGRVAPLRFDIQCDRGVHAVKLTPPVGELLKPFEISRQDFINKVARLGGMNENSATVSTSNSMAGILKQVLAEAAVASVESNELEGTLKLAGKKVDDEAEVFVSVTVASGQATIKCNTDHAIFGHMLVDLFKRLCA